MTFTKQITASPSLFSGEGRGELYNCTKMKKLLIIITLAFTITAAQAQTSSSRLSVNLRNGSLKEFAKQIESATKFSFIYGEEIKTAHAISLNVQGKTVTEVLDLAFANQPISYKITGNHILLQKKQPKPNKRRFTVSGYMTDATSSETLIGANILDSHSHQGTTTNAYGFYSITLPEGEVELNYSYLGYNTHPSAFTLTRETVLNVQMRDNTRLQEVVVLSNKSESGIIATHMGANEIPIAQIKHTPSILGEADLMKTIQLMPGVQAGVEGSAGLYVRGGGPDQNLILLDGVPVYNVDHLFGFFSVFTPEAVKKVTLFKSSFPARFGGRLSSVVDVRTNDGDMKKYHGTISIGLLTSKINFEGPIIKDRTSFSVSARRSYVDLLMKPFMPKDEKMSFYFYDINAKINHKFSDRDRLFFSFYNGKDHFMSGIKEFGDNGEQTADDKWKMNWGNTIASARWNHLFNSKLFSNTTVAYSHYNLLMSSASHYKYAMQENDYNSNYKSGIRDWSYRIDFDYNPVPNHHIKFGAGYLYHRFQPEVSTSRIKNKENSSTTLDTIYNNQANSQIYAHEVSAYVEDNFDLTSSLRINAGVHFSLFHVQKKSYFSVQPRLSLRYQLLRDVSLKASYTQMNQYTHLLSSTPIAMPTDLWVPVTNKIKPMKAHQYSLGAYYTGILGWEFSVEGYYKSMKNVLEYKEGVSFFGSSTGWEDKVEMGLGRSMGIEFMAQKNIGKTTGWVAYTLAKSDRKFSKGGINNGERFPYKYDRRHNISLTVNHKFNERIDIGASWTFATGGTATLAEEVTNVIRPGDGSNNGYGSFLPMPPTRSSSYNYSSEKETDYIAHRNNYRFPSSHRLNLGINFNKKTRHGIRTWNISIYNAYNAMNPTFIYRETKPESHLQPDGSLIWTSKPYIKKTTILPCIPSITYTYKF